MWFSIIVPTMIAIVWISPKLRSPRVWLGLCLAAVLGTTIWLGKDLYRFVESGGATQDLPLRVLYEVLRDTGTPAVPVILGSFLAGVFCWRYPSELETDAEASLASD